MWLISVMVAGTSSPMILGSMKDEDEDKETSDETLNFNTAGGNQSIIVKETANSVINGRIVDNLFQENSREGFR